MDRFTVYSLQFTVFSLEVEVRTAVTLHLMLHGDLKLFNQNISQ